MNARRALKQAKVFRKEGVTINGFWCLSDQGNRGIQRSTTPRERIEVNTVRGWFAGECAPIPRKGCARTVEHALAVPVEHDELSARSEPMVGHWAEQVVPAISVRCEHIGQCDRSELQLLLRGEVLFEGEGSAALVRRCQLDGHRLAEREFMCGTGECAGLSITEIPQIAQRTGNGIVEIGLHRLAARLEPYGYRVGLGAKTAGGEEGKGLGADPEDRLSVVPKDGEHFR